MNKLPLAKCGACPLRSNKNKVVQAFGPKQPKLIVVGDGPDQHAAFYSHPFVGQDGNMLRVLLDQQGLDPQREVAYLYTAACWPRTTKDKARRLAEASEHCTGAFKRALSRFPKDVPVLVLGHTAQDAVGLRLEHRWEQVDGRWMIGAPSLDLVMMSPLSQFVYLERTVKKAVAYEPEKWANFRPENEPYEIDPPTLPDLNQNWRRICVDIETTTTDWTDPNGYIFIVGIDFDGEHRLLLTREYIAELPERQAWLRALFAHHGDIIGGHNFKFDVLFLHKQWDVPLVIGWDTIAMVNVVHEYWMKGLKKLSTFYFDIDDYDNRLVHDWLERNIKRAADRSYDKVPQEQIIPYLLNDIGLNLKLADLLEQELKDLGQWEMPYLGHELPQVNFLAEVERHGFTVDLARVRAEQRAMAKDIQFVEEAITELSDGIITKPGSYKQIREYLYEYEGRPVANRTDKGAPSTDYTTLLEHQDLPAIAALIFYRRITKLKSSYLDNLLDFLRKDKQGHHRAHPSYKFWNVVTHRLSAENPAIQTIPHKDARKDTMPEDVLEHIQAKHPAYEPGADYGTRIKDCYTVPEGRTLIGVDGGSWEVACAVAQTWALRDDLENADDDYLVKAFREGKSPHTMMCDVLWPDGWTQAMRTREKNIFFGWMYGGSINALVYETNLPIADVTNIVDLLEENLDPLKEWRLKMQEQAKEGGIRLAHFNYIFHFDLITKTVLKDLPKQAVNYPNQGLGSLLITKAAMKVNPELKRMGGHIVALVHDAYYAEVPDAFVPEAVTLMKQAIIEAGKEFSDIFPWSADAELGKRWGSLEEVE